MFPLILFNIVFTFNRYILAEIQPAIDDDGVNEPFQGLMTFSPMLDKKINDTFTILNDLANYKRAINQVSEYFSSTDKDDRNIVAKVNKLNSVEGLRAISGSEDDGLQLFNKDLIKRSAAYGIGDRKRNIPKKKQKKIKILGRLLIKNNNDEATQDDCDEEDEDANGEDSQNDDNPNIMELIAFKPRRKSNTNRTRKVKFN
ncbi:uncharacterized protein LOC108628877 [Ceratina calcarata]|uniref:Uncharacterized protein LOC108628877 n=1 Tax=Ceratina calcarata TaxID=156304 RepID=A0AAJ7NB56_9HYME|nr:uncharacterized protein LOC108628877 [Ceratina calcarata]